MLTDGRSWDTQHIHSALSASTASAVKNYLKWHLLYGNLVLTLLTAPFRQVGLMCLVNDLTGSGGDFITAVLERKNPPTANMVRLIFRFVRTITTTSL